jgi:hypothetical protein
MVSAATSGLSFRSKKESGDQNCEKDEHLFHGNLRKEGKQNEKF